MSDDDGDSTPFADEVRREVTDLLATYPGLGNEGNAFAVWAVHFVHELDVDEALDAVEPRVTGAGDRGIDAFVSDDLSQVVYLVQCKYSADFDQTFDERAARELLGGLDLLLSDRYASMEGAPFLEMRDKVLSALEGDSEIVLQLVLAGRLASDARTRIEELVARRDKELRGDRRSSVVRVDIRDADALSDLDLARRTARNLEGVKVKFDTATDSELTIPASASGLNSAHVVVLDGASLVDAVEVHKSRLVDLNLRYQLKTSKINDAIAETIQQPDRQSTFSLLNNGLTITCESYEAVDGAVVLENPQIVNGGQTTMVLYENGHLVQPGRVQVLARIIATAGAAGHDLAMQIAESTNRQNPIRPSDLKANDEIQKRIQRDFQTLDPPWFYERRRNERAALPPHERQRYGKRIVIKEDVGQRWRAFTGWPASAITGKQRIFEQQDIYGKTFTRRVDVRLYLLAHQAFAFFYFLLDPKAEVAQAAFLPQMGPTERTELLRARNQWAGHCAAALGHVLHADEARLTRDAAVALTTELDGPLRDGEGKSANDIRLVTISGYKWYAGKRHEYAARDEVFPVKAEFEKPQTFESWKVEVDANRALLVNLQSAGAAA